MQHSLEDPSWIFIHHCFSLSQGIPAAEESATLPLTWESHVSLPGCGIIRCALSRQPCGAHQGAEHLSVCNSPPLLYTFVINIAATTVCTLFH